MRKVVSFLMVLVLLTGGMVWAQSSIDSTTHSSSKSYSHKKKSKKTRGSKKKSKTKKAKKGKRGSKTKEEVKSKTDIGQSDVEIDLKGQ